MECKRQRSSFSASPHFKSHQIAGEKKEARIYTFDSKQRARQKGIGA
jgi:hypothetical protein